MPCVRTIDVMVLKLLLLMMMNMLVVEFAGLVIREALVTVYNLTINVSMCTTFLLLAGCHSRLVMTVHIHGSALSSLCSHSSAVLAAVALTATAGSEFL